jgi:hypothetical protein
VLMQHGHMKQDMKHGHAVYLVCKSVFFILIISGFAEVRSWTSVNAKFANPIHSDNLVNFFSPLISGRALSGTY